jgi:hypothetical protein
MPKLLDYIKETGYSHEEVMALLKSNPKESEEEDESPEEEDSEEEDEEVIETEDEDTEEEEKSESEIKISKDELSKLINKAVEERLKVIRKPPSKGKKKKPSLLKDKPALTKAMFEVKV